jgi:hypothetical protein
MEASSVPAKFAMPWATNAGSTYSRAIPVTTANPVAASLSLGFPPDTATPVGSGGTPPDVRDENGILNQITAWNQWQQAGGPVYYDATFSSNIGGYPIGSVLSNAAIPGAFWSSTVDNNTSDPDTGGANWDGFNLVGLGTAAYKAASSNSLAAVASISGAIVAGHVAIFADAAGSIADGGTIGPFGSAASKNTTNAGLGVVSAFSGASTIGHFASFVDGAGSLQDGSYGPASFDAAGSAATAQSNAESFAISAVAVETARAEAAEALLAPLSSPALINNPTAPTQAPGTNNTTIATTAFVQAAIGKTIRYARVAVVFSAQSFRVASFSWDSAFPTTCLAVTATAETNDSFNPAGNGNNFVCIVYGAVGGTSGGTVRVDTEQGGNATGTCYVDIVGIGD